MSGLRAEGMATRGRGLGVSTLLALVAAIAVGLAVTRTLPDFLFLLTNQAIVMQFSASGTGSSYQSYGVGFPSTELYLGSRWRVSYWLEQVPYWSGPCLVSLTVAMMVLGMRRPRPRRAARRPGRVVGIAVLLALAWKSEEFGVLLAAWWRSSAATWNPASFWENAFSGHWAYFWLTLPGPAGFAVVVGWMALALGGRRPPAPDAVERLARAIGWAWIALALSSAAGNLCLALDL
jgi:hypothetical protein